MPHPSGPNAYPSAPGNYPSAPDQWQAAAVASVTSSATANAAVVAGIHGAATSAGTATANRTSRSNAATGHATSSGTAAVFVGHPAKATGTGTAIGRATATLTAVAAASGTVTASGIALGGRVQSATASGSAASSGGVGEYVIERAVVTVTVTADGTADGYAQRFAHAAATVTSYGIEGTARTAAGQAVSDGYATAGIARDAVAVALAVSHGVASGTHVVPAAAAATVSSSGVAGSVIALQDAASGAVTSSGVAVAVAFTPALRLPPGPVKPQVAVPRQRLLVIDTVTGRLIADLPYSNLEWSTPLNQETSLTASLVVEAALQAVFEQGVPDPRETLREVLTGPYRFSLVVCYGTTPVMGGPLLPTDDEQDAVVKVAAAGMERMLDRRLLVRRLPGNTDPLAYASRDVILNGTNIRNAVVQVVAEATATYEVPRPLPIFCAHPPPVDGGETFTWLAYDTKTAWSAITDLVQRTAGSSTLTDASGAPLPTSEEGPDVRIEPMLSEDDLGTYVWWDLQIGNPTFDIPPGTYGPSGPLAWTWDDSIATITRTVDSAGMATDYIAAGNGSERGRLMAESRDDRLINLGFPAVEVVDSGGNAIKDLASLQRRADALEAAHHWPTDSWAADVPLDGDPPLGAYRRGDIARLEIRRKLLIKPGNYLRRITNIAGRSGEATATVTCDYEDKLANVPSSTTTVTVTG